MAYNNSPDSEFDPEMERVLRDHFDSEASDLRSPSDPWQWLESRMEEPAMQSFFSRLLGTLNPFRQFRLSPAFAGAGVAVVAVAVALAVWAVSSSGGPESSGGIAAIAPTEAPASAPLQTALPPSTEAPLTASAEGAEREPAAIAAEGEESNPHSESDITPTVGGTPAISPPPPVVAPTMLMAPTQTPVPPLTVPPTEVAMMERESVAESVAMEETESEEAASMPPPAPTPATVMVTREASTAPQATPAPAMAAMMGPIPTRTQADSRQASSPPPTGKAGPAGSAGPPPATNFRDYERQQFAAASEDNVSTFSLDTDRTSFQLALNWARAGYEVQPDSVRAEEWLNAFDYQYDQPSGNSEFAVTSDLFPHPLDEEMRLARISFQAPELVANKPLNVTLVLDASGSMASGNRVAIAQQAAESIRQSLRPNDRIAIVQFSTDVLDEYTVHHTHPNDGPVQSSIGWLQPNSSTNVQAGLNLGVRLADEARSERPDAYNYVILMSDGVANVDATDPFGILETAYDPDSRNPLRLITIGVGIENYNDLLLEQLAQHGNGWYRYLNSVEQAQVTFTRENWLALSTPFADQARAQVTWETTSVERWRIIGYENRVTADENFTQDRKEFAEIYSGSATTVLYELELAASAPSSDSIPLGTVELRWVDPDTRDTRGQLNALSGNPGSGFVGRDGSLSHFGAIVALVADLYGSLSATGDIEEAAADLHIGLSDLQLQLQELDDDLGSLDSYKDFSFLLQHLANGVEEGLPPLPGRATAPSWKAPIESFAKCDLGYNRGQVPEFGTIKSITGK